MSTPVKRRAPIAEADLVARTLAGDEAAFTAIYEQHHERVFALLTRMLGPIAERDDLLQESFLQLYQALPSFRGDASIATFLYRIVSRLAAKAGKRRKREPLAFDSELLGRCFGEASGSKGAQDRQRLGRVFGLLLNVRVERRIAFVLSAVEGLSYAEVGEVLAIGPDAAKQRCLRARRDLKKLLDKEERMEQP